MIQFMLIAILSAMVAITGYLAFNSPAPINQYVGIACAFFFLLDGAVMMNFLPKKPEQE